MNSHANLSAQTDSRRRNYIINPTFQWRYAVMVALAVFVLTSLMSSALYSVLHQQARNRAMHPETYTTAVSSVVLIAAVAFAAVTSGALGLWCMLFTHRICGPLFVLDGYLKEMCEGKLPNPRKLRKKDEFKEVYGTFTKFAEWMKDERASEFEMMNKAIHTAQLAANEDLAACQKALKDVAGQLEPLRRQLADSLGTEAPAAPNPSTPKAESRKTVSVG